MEVLILLEKVEAGFTEELTFNLGLDGYIQRGQKRGKLFQAPCE